MDAKAKSAGDFSPDERNRYRQLVSQWQALGRQQAQPSQQASPQSRPSTPSRMVNVMQFEDDTPPVEPLSPSEQRDYSAAQRAARDPNAVAAYFGEGPAPAPQQSRVASSPSSNAPALVNRYRPASAFSDEQEIAILQNELDQIDSGTERFRYNETFEPKSMRRKAILDEIAAIRREQAGLPPDDMELLRQW